jgi:hypothetical protein
MKIAYGLTKVISLLIRQFLLSNPFENFQYGVLYNIAAGVILLPLTFLMVGIIYERSSNPMWGSILFLIMYFVNNSVLVLCSLFGFNLFISIPIIVAYFITYGFFSMKYNDFARGF